jgi:hypothetical protein
MDFKGVGLISIEELIAALANFNIPCSKDVNTTWR